MKGKKQLFEDLKNFAVPAVLLGLYWLFMKTVWNLGICPLKNITGFPCPACGISRAFLLFLKGDFSGAFQMHPFFYPVLLLGLWAAFQRYVLGRSIRSLQYPAGILGVGMIVYYVYRMYHFFPYEEPMMYEWNSLLGRTDIFEQLHIAEYLKM